MCDKCGVHCNDVQSLKSRYSSDKLTTKFILRDISATIKQMKITDDNFFKALREHMEEEGAHHLAIREHIAATNEALKNVTTKSEHEVTKGKIRTMWILGGLLFMGFVAVAGVTVELIRDEIKETVTEMKEEVKKHNTEASKKNYHGIKRVIEKKI